MYPYGEGPEEQWDEKGAEMPSEMPRGPAKDPAASPPCSSLPGCEYHDEKVLL